MLQLIMFDGSLMLQVNLPVANSVHSKGNRFVTGVMIKVTGDLTFNDSTDSFQYQVSLYGNGDGSSMADRSD